MIHHLVLLVRQTRNTSADRYNRNKVNERTAAFSIINNSCLALLVCHQVLLEMSNSLVRRKPSRLASLHLPIRALQEAAVAPEHLRLAIARQPAKARRAIDDRVVVSPHVDDDKGTGEVDWAEYNPRMGPCGNASQNGKNIKTRGRVDD
jgi:hypothetical protein